MEKEELKEVQKRKATLLDEVLGWEKFVPSPEYTTDIEVICIHCLKIYRFGQSALMNEGMIKCPVIGCDGSVLDMMKLENDDQRLAVQRNWSSTAFAEAKDFIWGFVEAHTAQEIAAMRVQFKPKPGRPLGYTTPYSHQLKHLFSEILLLGALVLPFAIALAALVGLASWIIGGSAGWFRASWITWGVTIVIVPIALRFSFGPDTRTICDRCLTSVGSWLKGQHGKSLQKEQRRHPRYHVELCGTFFSDRTSGVIKVGNISQSGCRVESNVPVTSGDFGQLLIDLPGSHAPLKISQALVRWVTGAACGMEFIHIEQDDQGLLGQLIGRIAIGSEVRTGG